MSEAQDRIVCFEQEGAIAVGTIRTTSVLSAINVADFGSEVVAHIEGAPGINLLLNFENVDYLSSAVLTELLRINKAIQEARGQLRLCGVSKVILEIFRITNLDKMFTIYHDDVTGGARRFLRSLEVAAEDAAWKDPM